MTIAKSRTNKTQVTPTLSVFGAKPKDAILVPNSPLNVRCNCQSGTWNIADTEYGKKLEMTILKFSRFYGNLGQTRNAIWGQIFFIAESGDLPLGVVLTTYIKTRSLSDFERLVAETQAKGIEPATGIFTPEFTKQSGSIPDGKGGTQVVNYYSVKWSWKEREEQESLIQAANALSQSDKFVDFQSTKNMFCIDGLSQSELETMISKFSQADETTAITSTF